MFFFCSWEGSIRFDFDRSNKLEYTATVNPRERTRSKGRCTRITILGGGGGEEDRIRVPPRVTFDKGAGVITREIRGVTTEPGPDLLLETRQIGCNRLENSLRDGIERRFSSIHGELSSPLSSNTEERNIPSHRDSLILLHPPDNRAFSRARSFPYIRSCPTNK